tara:strand:+ start:122 stop:442 length:321 start_codon:yes stop_codon:yes gene_type:complete
MSLILLLSGCKAVRTAAAAPFKAVSWGAGKISEVVGGKGEKPDPKIYELNPDGTLSEKSANGSSSSKKNNIKINFKPLVVWGIIFVSIALIVRFLMNRYVYKTVKK